MIKMKKILTLLLFMGTMAQNALADDFTYSITMPADAELFLGTKPKSGTKDVHYAPFLKVEPTNTTVTDGVKTVSYTLASDQQYNYRTWKSGGLTQGGVFTANSDAAKMPALAFTAEDYAQADAKLVKRDNLAQTGDIYVNINERGHLQMKSGEERDLTALRNWEAVNTVIANYFIEPDYHYTVTNLQGEPDNSVVELDTYDTTTSPWVTLKAKKKGAAIVTVTYDAMNLLFYDKAKTTGAPFVNGPLFGAIWPENTAAFVVTVDDDETAMTPNMQLNAQMANRMKLAGDNADAELDVFYFVGTEGGYKYTFTPEGVAAIDIAYPSIGDNAATYSGFSADGVEKNGDGSYTILLKHGRNIVRMTDANGNSIYQVLTAKAMEYTLTNATDASRETFKPGDKVTVTFKTLYHPVNKLAGVYNMTATACYNNGKTKGRANQYAFASTAAAQQITITIAATAEKDTVLTNGSIFVSGFGDYHGNHRYFTKESGRNPNLNAGMVQTYLCALPDIVIPVDVETGVEAVAESVSANGIETITTLDGKRVDALQRGVNIVRMKNGNVCKVVRY